MKETAKFNIAVTSAALLSVVFVLITGSTSVDERRSIHKPFVPPEFGFRGILSGASMVFFTTWKRIFRYREGVVSRGNEKAKQRFADWNFGVTHNMRMFVLLYGVGDYWHGPLHGD